MPIYVVDGQATGKRSVHLNNAYHMIKALAKAGWLVIENEGAMIVKITDEGIRVAT